MQQKFNIGVIGCGKIAQTRHIPELYEHPDVHLFALCDTKAARAAEIASTYHVPHLYESIQPMLAHPQLDGVIICTPNQFHATHSMHSLQAGKHVLLEKPMATTMEDCERMVKEAKKQNKIFLVAHNQRLHPVYQKAKEILQSDIIGNITQFTTNFHHGGPEHWSIEGEDSWFLREKFAYFGVLGDLGIHKIDIIHWLLEDEMEQVSTYTHHQREQVEVEDNAVIIAKMKKGAIGSISVSWSNPLQDHRTVFYGTKGNLIFGESMNSLRIHLHDGQVIEEQVNLAIRQDQGLHSGVVDQFIQCMKQESYEQAECSGESALSTMKTLLSLT
ncbi:Gfo/Idh/MocA family protein [Longirhabdus pacifica]|uniref:Gfo/Idh/MocA family protein n=1 Tax=Longirhabdus pacifica TaxID=2305227 RepID=UPI0013E89D07|nr:Gfo/Idh/MocA family oxidoreductase [Longirhabdus pacifica]